MKEGIVLFYAGKKGFLSFHLVLTAHQKIRCLVSKNELYNNDGHNDTNRNLLDQWIHGSCTVMIHQHQQHGKKI